MIVKEGEAGAKQRFTANYTDQIWATPKWPRLARFVWAGRAPRWGQWKSRWWNEDCCKPFVWNTVFDSLRRRTTTRLCIKIREIKCHYRSIGMACGLPFIICAKLCGLTTRSSVYIVYLQCVNSGSEKIHSWRYTEVFMVSKIKYVWSWCSFVRLVTLGHWENLTLENWIVFLSICEAW